MRNDFVNAIFKSGTARGLLAVSLLLFGSVAAQNTTPSGGNSVVLSESITTVVFIGGALLLVVAFFMFMIVMNMYAGIREMSFEKHPELKARIEKEAKRTFMDKFNASVDIEDEKEVLLDHNYDGIRELDNNLPPWWKYGFYVSIVWGAIYLYAYHWSHIWPNSDEEFKLEMESATAQINAYLEKSAVKIDENSVTLITDAGQLENGKSNYTSVCATCHGNAGEGGIGPNLTDEYWLHGGSIKDIFKTIKYGVTDKGMPTWEAQYSPKEIAELASFIYTLKGTNPPNGKEKQGALFVEVSDSTVVQQSDSTLTDTTKTKK